MLLKMGGRGILGYHLSTKTKRVYCENVKKKGEFGRFFQFLKHCFLSFSLFNYTYFPVSKILRNIIRSISLSNWLPFNV